ncbi:MAG: hypothetical protein HYY50_00640 [Candidatus Kerfeldbacteria bacterium]|nr:hypothetical protein [Candidatus Kerfeldbacteria bacterium]
MRRLLVTLATAVFVGPTAYAGSTTVSRPLTVIRGDLDTSFKGTLLQIVGDRYVWDVIWSNQGWGEVDLGLNVTKGTWYLQSLLGVDFMQGEHHRTICGSFYPQLYAIHYGRVHAESWYVGAIPFHGAASTLHSFRELAVQQIGRAPLWLGGQYDAAASQGSAPSHFLGPLVEYEFLKDCRLGFTVQRQIGGPQSKFLLTIVTVR